MSYETFVSAVLLRQGEADAFLKAKPKDRKECLLEVLDLDFYKRLGKLTDTKKADARSDVKSIEQKLANFEQVSDADIQLQTRSIANINLQLVETDILKSSKELELLDAKQVINIQKDIRGREGEINNAQGLIQRENEIVSNLKRFRELESDIPQLRNILDIRKRIDDETREMARIEESINREEVRHAELVAEIDQAQNGVDTAKSNDDNLSIKLNKIRDQKDVLKGQAEQVSKIGELEKSIAEAKSKLAPYQDILNREAALDEEKQRYDALKSALPSLEDLLRAMEITTDLEKEKSKLEEEMPTLLENLDQTQSAITEKRNSVSSLEQTKGQIALASDELKSQITALKVNAESRDIFG
jgi:DNA repair exonuclease SbcCD ATPase subunit